MFLSRISHALPWRREAAPRRTEPPVMAHEQGLQTVKAWPPETLPCLFVDGIRVRKAGKRAIVAYERREPTSLHQALRGLSLALRVPPTVDLSHEVIRAIHRTVADVPVLKELAHAPPGQYRTAGRLERFGIFPHRATEHGLAHLLDSIESGELGSASLGSPFQAQLAVCAVKLCAGCTDGDYDTILAYLQKVLRGEPPEPGDDPREVDACRAAVAAVVAGGEAVKGDPSHRCGLEVSDGCYALHFSRATAASYRAARGCADNRALARYLLAAARHDGTLLYKAPSSDEVVALMDGAIETYLAQRAAAETRHARRLAIAQALQSFERIHPFEDCNGRVFANILQAWLMLCSGFLPAALYEPNRWDAAVPEDIARDLEAGERATRQFIEGRGVYASLRVPCLWDRTAWAAIVETARQCIELL
jgi:hypothetical protein